jgi:NADH-quinone oxidoreductase subunit G
MSVSPQTELVNVTIDGIALTVPKGTLVVEAAKLVARDVPVYCYHPKLGPAGLCRICLVEIEGAPKLQIGCNTPVAEGMVVRTVGQKVEEGRRSVLELLLLNHPLDCPICDKGGECDLQDFSMAYGQGASRLVDAKSSKPKAVDLGPTIVLDEERCILCLRCVRFDDIVTRERSLRTEDRGAHAMIATATGTPYVSDFSGNVTELCPVGALTSKTYRFKARPWDNRRTETTCTQCSVGCALNVDQRLGVVTRTMSVPDDDATSDGWLCDRGRYNIGYVSDERRLTQPLYRKDGEFVQIGWDDAIAIWAQAIRDALAAGGPAAVGAIGGGRLLNEEIVLLQHLYRALGVENLDWRAGRQWRAHTGIPLGTPEDLERADVIVTLGRTPAQLAPVLDLRIRKAVTRHRATLIAIGDHAASSVVSAQRVATFAEAIAAIPASAQRIAFVWDGVPHAALTEIGAWTQAHASLGKSLNFYILGEQPNARGADTYGMVPGENGADTEAMLAAARAGSLKTLAVFGANPALSWPDQHAAIEALRALPFLVVSDLFMTETAEFAHLILPACGGLEKTGSTTDLTGVLHEVNAVLPAPDGALADGDMLVALADALEVPIPALDALSQIVRERNAATMNFGLPPVPAPISASEGLRVVVASTILSGGGTFANDASLAELRVAPTARVHPTTASQLGLHAGANVVVQDGLTALEGLTLVLDANVPDDAVVLLAGNSAANPHRLRPTGVQIVAAEVVA